MMFRGSGQGGAGGVPSDKKEAESDRTSHGSCGWEAGARPGHPHLLLVRVHICHKHHIITKHHHHQVTSTINTKLPIPTIAVAVIIEKNIRSSIRDMRRSMRTNIRKQRKMSEI